MSAWGTEEAAATIVVTGGEEEARTTLMLWLGVASPRFVDGLLAREHQRRDVGGRGEKEFGDVAGEAVRAGATQWRAQLGATRGWSSMKWKAIVVVAACTVGRRRQQHSLWQRWVWEEDGGKGGAPTSSVET
ncbi:hypothetical protein B296_00021735 [Ensete ventricosum]|uniref:Uncharacterized protein n=1 Tax=Ensete ventricosum TaxID=4639 RepID=A0A427AAT3_ENSVE|nr:hypothetical protein B296_00021735 [Ensete ventricosum]